MIENSTICAIATAGGRGATALIRISGKQAIHVCKGLLTPQNTSIDALRPRKLYKCTIGTAQESIDEVLAVFFKAPNSYTGEDVVEISCHGSIYIQQKIVELLIANGARLAQPGEFTMRAFLNGKLDLSQSEAVAQLIESSSKTQHLLAMNQLKGGISNEIALLRNKLIDFIGMVELELDFAEEDVEFADRDQLSLLITDICAHISGLIASFRYGNAIRNGVPVAIVGRPNTGKSSLLNLLLGDERAIVSHIPGTTRDSIEDTVVINGILFRCIDTAGIRETGDSIEQMGIERSLNRIGKSDIVILVEEAGAGDAQISQSINQIMGMMNLGEQQLLVLLNKADLESRDEYNLPAAYLLFSNLTRLNEDALHTRLCEMVQAMNRSEGNIVISNLRHLEALQAAQEALGRAQNALMQALPADLMAQDVREAIHHMGAITGSIGSDEVLGNIFKNFCIGK